MLITIREHPGRCRWCGCTEDNPCEAGCGWASRRQTLCSACVELDRMIRSTRGRAQIAEICQIGLEDLARFR